ncbi:hypothetical protein E2I00_011714, partial [Balaenoptera physalus]
EEILRRPPHRSGETHAPGPQNAARSPLGPAPEPPQPRTSSSRRRPPPSSCRLTQPAGMGRDRPDHGGTGPLAPLPASGRETNPGQPNPLPSLHLCTGWRERPEVLAQQLGWKRANLSLSQAFVSHAGNPHPSLSLPMEDECCKLSPQASNKLKSLPQKR